MFMDVIWTARAVKQIQFEVLNSILIWQDSRAAGTAAIKMQMRSLLLHLGFIKSFFRCSNVQMFRCSDVQMFTQIKLDEQILGILRQHPVDCPLGIVSRPTIWSFIYIWVSLLIQISKKYRAAMHYIGQCPCCPGWKHILQFANRKILSPIFVLSPRPQCPLCLGVHLKYHLAMIGQRAGIQMSQLKSGGSCWSQLDQMLSHSYLIQIQKC